MTYGFFRYCSLREVLWQGAVDVTCWICGALGTICEDDFVYTADSMNAHAEATSEL
jgi:hypothetical protein